MIVECVTTLCRTGGLRGSGQGTRRFPARGCAMSDVSETPPTIPAKPLYPASANPRGRSPFLDVALLSRWRRRGLIREIEAETGRTLLCYVSRDSIELPDTFHLTRLLEAIDQEARITLLLDSPGGDVDAAEKFVHLLREACESPSRSRDALEVVVPQRAKSAATLIALGADRIVMSDSSELGPIDPQLRYGPNSSIPVFAILRAYEKAERRCAKFPDNTAFAMALRQFDQSRVEWLRLTESRARTCAENLLKRQGGSYTAAPAKLMDVSRFLSHGQMIDWRTAKEIGIPQVHFRGRRTPIWQQYWRLYKYLVPVCGANGRVFESRDMTIIPSK